jgi:hypothetical protein
MHRIGTFTWPDHVVCAWIGNSKAVAMEHYNQVTDEHFKKSGTESGTVPGRNRDIVQESDFLEDSQSDDLQGDTSKYYPDNVLNMGRAGFEPA